MPPEQKTPVKDIKTSAGAKKKGGWFQKIPKDIILSPGGLILVFIAALIEILDWIPLPFIDQIWELPLEIIFVILLIIIVKDISWKAMVIPFALERISILNDIIPTWFIKMFM